MRWHPALFLKKRVMRRFVWFLFILSVLRSTAQESCTNRYGLYLHPTPEGYLLRDRNRLMANDTIPPCISYSRLLRQPELLVPYTASDCGEAPQPQGPTEIRTVEYELKKLKSRTLKVKIDLPAKADAPHPFIVFIHGGGWHIGSEEGFREQARRYVSAGIAAVRVSYTLIPEGGTFRSAHEELQAALDLVQVHAKELNLDPDNFGFCGDSAGGYLASYMAMTTPGTRLLIGICGMYDLTRIDLGYFPGQVGCQRFFGTDDPQNLKSYSPRYLVPQNPPATLLLHGTADPTINCEQSLHLAREIRRKGGIAELALYDGYGHLFSLKQFSDKYDEVLLKAVAFARQVFFREDGRESRIFRAGDRVSFLGNSITQQGHYLRYLMQFYATRFPDMPLVFRNAGVSGDTTEDINRRLSSEVFPELYDVNVLMSGMNDAFRYGRTAEKPADEEPNRAASVAKYEREVNTLLTAIDQTPGRIILFTPSIYDETARLQKPANTHVNTTLRSYRRCGLKLARQYDIPVVDMWQGLTKINQLMQKRDPSASIIGADRVHPGPSGGLAMARLFVERFEKPSVVSRVTIDAAENRCMTENGTISDLYVSEGSCSFVLSAASLPFVTDATTDGTCPSSFDERFNREIVRISHLRSGVYSLAIDCEPIGEYTSEELRQGVDLSHNAKTPQYRQGQSVSVLCEQMRIAMQEQRQLKWVEYCHIGASKANDADTCLAVVKRRLGQASEKRPEWLTATFRWYLANKPREAGFSDRIDSLRILTYRQAQPLPHRYVIRRIR